MIVAVCFCMLVLRICAALTHTAIEPAWPRGNLDRAAVIQQLKRQPGRHLVLVRYQPSYGINHDVDHEWVYNEADIDDAKIVWARDMGEQENHELLQYFHNRQVWQINGDASPPRLEAYSAAASAH